MRIRPLSLAAAVAAAIAGPAYAATCKNAAGQVTFGNYDPLVANRSAPLDVAGSVTYDCSPPVAPVISLGWGNAGSNGTRTLQSGPNVLSYNLYADATRLTVWGDGKFGSRAIAGPGAQNASVPVYGRIFGGQNVAAGSYADSVLITINY